MIEYLRTLRWKDDLIPRAILIVGLLIYGVAITSLSSFAAGGFDSSGYVNTGHAIVKGELIERAEILDRLELASSYGPAFLPLAHLPGDDPRTITPFYPVGFPLHLAVAEMIGGLRSGPYYVIPLLATLSLLFIYLVGRELELSRWFALGGSLMLGICTVFVFQAQGVMSDVAATCWALIAVFGALRARRHSAWALLAGAAVGMGVLIRPSNALLLLPALFGLPWKPRCLIYFILGGIPMAVIMCAYNQLAFGGPFTTGYDRMGVTVLLTFRGFTERFKFHVYWTAAMMSPLIFVGWLGVIFDRYVLWRYRVLLFLWFAEFLIFYACYDIYDVWWYTRFLLPAYPALILASMLVARDLGTIFSQPRRQLLARSAAALILVLLSIGFSHHLIQKYNVLGVGKDQWVNRVACYQTGALIPKKTLVVSMEMSGALKLYTGHPVVRWDMVQPQQIETIKAQAASHGYQWAALMLPHELETAQQRVPGKWQRIRDFGNISLWSIRFN